MKFKVLKNWKVASAKANETISLEVGDVIDKEHLCGLRGIPINSDHQTFMDAIKPYLKDGFVAMIEEENIPKKSEKIEEIQGDKIMEQKALNPVIENKAITPDKIEDLENKEVIENEPSVENVPENPSQSSSENQLENITANIFGKGKNKNKVK